MIIVDLPGTVNSRGVFNTIVNMDYVITPIAPDRIVMQSSLAFSTTVIDYSKERKDVPSRISSSSGTRRMVVLRPRSLTPTILL